MPTATMTATATSAISLKGSTLVAGPSSSAAATLRSLYPRAARAFLQRDVALTFSLLSSAFALITPPATLTISNDALVSHRRKWEILRLTFETTLYASPPSNQDPDSLPSSLRANLMLSPEPLLATLHSRSLQLFTPSDSVQKATSAFLPAQILVTLVLASLKLDSPEVGRSMIEDWLAKHGQESDADDPKGYAKVLELYCIHVLPRLQDWEYAEDFLTYERELPPDLRQQFILSLRQLRTEAATAAEVRTTLPADPLPSPSSSGSSTPSRLSSPAMSDSSSSTHTATPRTSRPHANGLAPLTPSHSQSPTPTPRDRTPHSASSSSIASTATSRTVTPQTAGRERAHSKPRHANGHARAGGDPQRPTMRSRSSTPASSASVMPRSSSVGVTETSGTVRSPSTLALVRASLASLFQGTSRSQTLLYAVIFVVVPLLSFVVRLKRKQVRGSALNSDGTSSSAVAAVRRRLRTAEGQGNLMGKVWTELVRAVLDTVSMAGRGLV